MSLLTGPLALVWATIIAVPVALVVTGVVFWAWRVYRPLQQIVMPGADESRMLERYLYTLLAKDTPSPAEMQTIGQVGKGVLVRNGLNALALVLCFAVVFTGAHALLMVL